MSIGVQLLQKTGWDLPKQNELCEILGIKSAKTYRSHLNYLIENANIALSRDKILNNVWNYDYYGDSRTIDSHIKKIRHKLGKKGKYIKTIRGVGYKFEIK